MVYKERSGSVEAVASACRQQLLILLIGVEYDMTSSVAYSAEFVACASNTSASITCTDKQLVRF
eukprot:5730-Heterococcus_DN1.PRE.10